MLFHKTLGLFLFLQTIGVAQAVIYSWILTYGDAGSSIVCHARFSVILGNHSPWSNPEIILKWVECVTNGDPGNGFGTTIQLPTTGSQRAVSYITTLDPHTQRGDVGFEVGINQPAFRFADREIPAMNPRFNLYTDSNAVFLGHCSYRQGAIQVAQTDGTAENHVYSPAPTHNQCPAGTSQDRRMSIGRWLVCQLGCNKF